MPIYQYQCETKVCPYCETPYVDQDTGECCKETVAHARTCGHVYEIFYTSFGVVEREEADAECEVCGGKNKTKLISQGTSHILKGKGWARDNYS